MAALLRFPVRRDASKCSPGFRTPKANLFQHPLNTAQATEQDLWALFAPLGEILELYVLRNNQTGRSRGCAFVTYASRHLAQQVQSPQPLEQWDMTTKM